MTCILSLCVQVFMYIIHIFGIFFWATLYIKDVNLYIMCGSVDCGGSYIKDPPQSTYYYNNSDIDGVY